MSRQFEEQRAAFQREYGPGTRRGKSPRTSRTPRDATSFDVWKAYSFIWTLTVLVVNGFSPFWPSVVLGIVVGTLFMIPHRFLPRLTSLFSIGVCALTIWSAIAGV
jgi:hypothetical protein